MHDDPTAEAPWFRFYEPGVPRSIDYPDATLPDLLDLKAEKFPDRPAIRFFVDPKLPPSTLTYRELQDQTRRFAAALYGLGVRKGERVAIMLPNCPQFVIAFFGTLRLGAIAVNTNPLYVAREMLEQFRDAGCETVVLLDQFFPRMREIHAASGVRRIIVADIAETLAWPARALVHLVQWRRGERVRVRMETDIFSFSNLIRQYGPPPPATGMKPDDVALFQYTGGTTGTPKAAMLSHRNLVANALQVVTWDAQMTEGAEVMMGALPFFHVYGMTTCMLFAVTSAAEMVLIPRPRPVDGVMKLIQKTRATGFPGVPTLYTAINNHPDVKKYDLSSIRCCVSGAAPLPVEVQQRFEELTGAYLVEGYGLSESSPVTHANPFKGTRKEGSIGVPLPDTDARIVDLETRETLPVGQEGELAVHGPQVMKGYWNRPEDTAKTVQGGWLLTGDVARMDEDGFFYIVDRKKDMIDASGFKVLPREVEEVLYMHPAVREAAVAGVPDAYRGETVKAFVVLKEGQTASEKEIQSFCRKHLAAFKVPRIVDFRDDLPKSMVGKILRRVLVEEESSKPPADGAPGHTEDGDRRSPEAES